MVGVSEAPGPPTGSPVNTYLHIPHLSFSINGSVTRPSSLDLALPDLLVSCVGVVNLFLFLEGPGFVGVSRILCLCLLLTLAYNHSRHSHSQIYDRIWN